MEQTAVQWLEKGFYRNGIGDEIPPFLKDLFEQAKAIEKEQMYKCASFWRGKENEIEKPIFEQYYKENYGNTNSN